MCTEADSKSYKVLLKAPHRRLELQPEVKTGGVFPVERDEVSADTRFSQTNTESPAQIWMAIFLSLGVRRLWPWL